VAWKREEIAHNGVRSDDDVEVREPRQVGNGFTNSDEEDDYVRT